MPAGARAGVARGETIGFVPTSFFDQITAIGPGATPSTTEFPGLPVISLPLVRSRRKIDVAGNNVPVRCSYPARWYFSAVCWTQLLWSAPDRWPFRGCIPRRSGLWNGSTQPSMPWRGN